MRKTNLAFIPALLLIILSFNSIAKAFIWNVPSHDSKDNTSPDDPTLPTQREKDASNETFHVGSIFGVTRYEARPPMLCT